MKLLTLNFFLRLRKKNFSCKKKHRNVELCLQPVLIFQNCIKKVRRALQLSQNWFNVDTVSLGPIKTRIDNGKNNNGHCLYL